MTTPNPSPLAPASVSGRCPNCGDDVPAGGRGSGRVFCRQRCRELYAARNKSEGAPILPFILAWTETRHAKPGTREAAICKMARREVTAMARDFIERRKVDGQTPAADYVETILRHGESYADRTRKRVYSYRV